jgi:hypothetical protein
MDDTLRMGGFDAIPGLHANLKWLQANRPQS